MGSRFGGFSMCNASVSFLSEASKGVPAYSLAFLSHNILFLYILHGFEEYQMLFSVGEYLSECCQMYAFKNDIH